MNPLPTTMASHWWQRPGRLPGRELYHWHMLFHDQPRVRELAAMAQQRLAGLLGLDMVPARWLHLTTLIVGFADEIPDGQIGAMAADARRRLAAIAPVPVARARCLPPAGGRPGPGAAGRPQPSAGCRAGRDQGSRVCGADRYRSVDPAYLGGLQQRRRSGRADH